VVCVEFAVSSTEDHVPEEVRDDFWGSNLGVFLGEMPGIKLRQLGVVGGLAQAIARQAVAPALVDRRIDGEWSCSEVD